MENLPLWEGKIPVPQNDLDRRLYLPEFCRSPDSSLIASCASDATAIQRECNSVCKSMQFRKHGQNSLRGDKQASDLVTHQEETGTHHGNVGGIGVAPEAAGAPPIPH